MTERDSWRIFLRGFGLAEHRRPKPHVCSQCRRHFRRRNLVETWARTPSGTWEKRIVKICTRCHTFAPSPQLRLVRRSA